MAGVLDLFGKIVIDTRSVEQTIETLNRVATAVDEVGTLTDEQSKRIKKSIDKQAESFDKLADDVKKANDAKEAAARIEQVMNNNITKATNTIANYVATVKRAAVSEAEKTKLIGEAVGTLNSYEASLKNGDKSSLAFATANTQLAATVGQLSRDLKVATTSLGDQQSLSVATIRSMGQLESVFLRTTAAVKQSSMTDQDKIKQLNDLQVKYTEAKTALQTYGTGNAEAALQQVNFRKQVALTRTEVDKFNQATKARELENWRAQMTNLTKSVQLALGPLSGIASRITALTGLFNRNAAGLAALFASMTAFTVLLAQSARAGVETERQLAGLQSRIEVLGLAAITSGQQFNEMAHRLAANTLSSASAVREAQGALLEFGNIGVSSFERVITAAIGMQSTFGGGLNEQIAKLGRILDDPIKNFDALTRRGITFNKQEREKITLLQQSGQLFQAQQIILEKFNGFGAKATDETETLAGALDTVSGNMDLLREKLFVGSKASEESTKQVLRFAQAITDFTDSGAAEALGQSFVVSIRAVGNSINWIKENFTALLPVFTAYATAVGVKAVFASSRWALGLAGLNTALFQNVAAVYAKVKATDASVVATGKAVIANNALRMSMLGIVGVALSAAAGIYAYVKSKEAVNKLSQNSSEQFRIEQAAIKEYTNSLSGLSEVEVRIQRERLEQAKKNTESVLENVRQQIEEEKKLISDKKPMTQAVNPRIAKAAREEIEFMNQRVRELEESEKRLTLAIGQQNIKIIESNKALDERNKAARTYDYTNVEETIKRIGDALDNESRALKAANDDLRILTQTRINAQTAAQGDGETAERAREQIPVIKRLIGLQQENIKYLEATTSARRQLNSEEALATKYQATLAAISRETAIYNNLATGSVGLQAALFGSKRLQEIESIKAEINSVANTTRDSAAFYKQLQESTGATAPTIDAIAEAIASQNMELEIAKKRSEELKLVEDARISLLPTMDQITARYQIQAQAVSHLSATEKAAYTEWLAIQQAKEQSQAEFTQRMNELQFSTMGTDQARYQMELMQLDQSFADKLASTAQYYANDQALLNTHVAEMTKAYQAQRAAMEFAYNMESVGKVFQGGMDMIAATGRQNSTAYKVMAIGQATIAGALAATKALAEGGPFMGPLLAGMIAVKTGANIAQIKAQQFATGGYVSGAGTGTSDSIPAFLSNGEYVIRQAAVQRIGLQNLEMINQGKMSAFNMGGSVGIIAANSPSNNSGENQMVVQIIDQRTGGGTIQQEETTDASGNRMLKVFVRDAVNEAIRSGSLDNAMSSTYGLSRQGIRR